MRIPRTGLASMHGQAITGARRINILFQAGVSMMLFLLCGAASSAKAQEIQFGIEGSIRRENGSVFFDVLSSRTDVVTVSIGVTFRF